MRKSLGIRSWEAGQALVRDWEVRRFGSITVSQAWERVLADCVARELRKETLAQYRLLERGMRGGVGGGAGESCSLRGPAAVAGHGLTRAHSGPPRLGPA